MMNDQLNKQADPEVAAKLEELTQLAVGLGASDAKIVPASEISAEDHLAALCKETRCPNYGLSPTCPTQCQGPGLDAPAIAKRGLRHGPQAGTTR